VNKHFGWSFAFRRKPNDQPYSRTPYRFKIKTNLVEIISDENGHVKAVITDKGETINCELVGLTTGVSPNIDFLKFWNRIRKRNQSESISGNEFKIYAIGDCAEQREAIGLTSMFDWRMMGEVLAQTLTGTLHISLETGSIQQNFRY
jgi:NAD(P)H-nitrite reductase large subunit